MRRLILLSLLAIATIVTGCCNSGSCEGDIITEEEVVTSIYCDEDSCYIVDGIIYENEPVEVITIISMDSDTLSFGSESAVIEGGSIIVGDTAMIYYIFDETFADGNSNCTNNSKSKRKGKNKECKETEKMPKAKKIVVKPTQK